MYPNIFDMNIEKKANSGGPSYREIGGRKDRTYRERGEREREREIERERARDRGRERKNKIRWLCDAVDRWHWDFVSLQSSQMSGNQTKKTFSAKKRKSVYQNFEVELNNLNVIRHGLLKPGCEACLLQSFALIIVAILAPFTKNVLNIDTCAAWGKTGLIWIVQNPIIF